MHRIHIGVVCLLMVLILGVSLEATGKDKDAGEQKVENMSVPMGVIVLKPDESIEQKKSSVAFNHSQHFIYDCKTCHHKWEGKTQIPKAKRKAMEMSYQVLKEKLPSSGPTGCIECHPKE